MNVLITTSCQKGCSFCFAREKNRQIENMTKENFLKVLDFIQNSHPTPDFKLLGGEPTDHPLFKEFVDEIIKRKLNFGLITNGIFISEEKMAAIIRAIEEGRMHSILINAAELKKNEEIEKKFAKNYSKLLKLYKTLPGFHLRCSVTLNREKSLKEEAEYIEWLVNKHEVHALRISIDFKGVNDLDEFFIDNKEYGEKILKILEICSARQILLSGDCLVYPCVFDDEFQVRKKLPELIKNLRLACVGSNSFPFDVSPDLTYFHCYPANVFKGGNLLDFANYQEALRDFEFRKNIIYQMKEIPERCKECQYYKEKLCHSLCLGCTKLESPLLEPVSA